MFTQFTHQDVFTTIVDTITEMLGTKSILFAETRLYDDLDMDSLEMVELGVILERKFAIKFSLAQIRSCTTLEDILNVVLEARQGVMV